MEEVITWHNMGEGGKYFFFKLISDMLSEAIRSTRILFCTSLHLVVIFHFAGREKQTITLSGSQDFNGLNQTLEGHLSL